MGRSSMWSLPVVLSYISDGECWHADTHPAGIHQTDAEASSIDTPIVATNVSKRRKVAD
jgi:hypothetical protein